MLQKKNKIFKAKNTIHGGKWVKGIFKKIDKENPLISIITVTLNSQKYLEETLKSIFDQKYKNYELIIIDGKSNDKTLKIIKKNNKKIDYWISQKDKGIYDAFNKGLALARGQYIGFVNSDDVLTKNSLKYLAHYHRSKKFDFLFGAVKKHWGVLHGYKKWKIKFSWGFYSSHSTGFFISNKAAKKVGKYNLKFKYHADWDYFYRMIIKKKLIGISSNKNELFGHFRRGGYSSNLTYDNHVLETIKIRLSNGQNNFFVLLITLYKFYKNLHLIKEKKKTFNNILSLTI
jgi:glycosyltransferase involved in cell wall biosynthesis|tara:strand:- start:7334 stop:8197 length:864 start_codon:yes stop_codon:yes gene_type:complete